MDRAWLHEQLAAGMSIESIAREVGRDPSTVSYWVAKYGLTSTHAPKHAARGGIAREQLEPLIDEGLSVRAIAERLGVSYTTVRHWLKKHGLKTRRAVMPRSSDSRTMERKCPIHGTTTFGRRRDGYFRCLDCRAEAVVKRRRAVKRILIEEAGGACRLCGYDRVPAALQFHHVDRSEKSFELSHRGATLSLDAARAEVAKCVLLCANCHAEVEAGAATVR
jgi:transposase